jgi:hypothetical protein
VQGALDKLRGLAGGGGASGGFEPKKRLRELTLIARRAPVPFALLVLVAALMIGLEVVSISSAGRRIAAIALAHTASTPSGPVPGAIGGHLAGLVDARTIALLLSLPLLAVAFARAARFPLQDFLDRAVFALVTAALALTTIGVIAARLVASPRHLLAWGLGDAPLLFLAALLCAGLVRLAVVRARWLDRVRNGLDREWSLELLQASVDRQLPLLPGQRTGDAVLLSHVAVPGRPSVSMALARVDYTEARGRGLQRAVYAGLGVVSLLFGLLIAGATFAPGTLPLAITPLDAVAKTFAYPDARPLEQAAGGATSTSAPTSTSSGAASAIVVPEDDSLSATPLVIGPEGKADLVNRGAGVALAVAAVDISPDGDCLRTLDGEIFCQKHDVTGFVKVKDITGAGTFSSRGEHGCAVVVGGEVRCWKDDSADVLIPAHSPPQAHAIRELPPAKLVAVGETFACIVSLDRSVRCWTGQGIPATPSQAVTGAEGALSIAAGTEHACVAQEHGTVACWGRNDLGQAGPAGTGSEVLATPVAGVDGAVEVAAGATHTCARLGSGAVTCWGFLDSGTWSAAPRNVPLEPALRLVARDGVICALQTNRIVCAGDRVAP